MNRPDKQYFPFIDGEKRLAKLAAKIRKETGDYIRHYRLSSLVLGISGGIDSALCAVLLKPVCEQYRIPLIGRSITIETNKQDEIVRSLAVGELFCHDFRHMDITDTFIVNRQNLTALDESTLSKLRQGNMKARMRMMILYDLAQLNKGIVISTDNYTEYLTGFWTLHGDVGDFAPIINLWKTEVYHLSQFLLQECTDPQKEALRACIDAIPVDGLGISSCDCEQLGVDNYYEADHIFQEYFANKNETLETHPLIQRFIGSAYKRKNPVLIRRALLVK